jgi:hypothetical protein
MAVQSLNDLGRLTYGRFLKLFRHSLGLLGRGINPSQGLYLHRTTQHRRTRTNVHALLSGIRTHDPSVRAATVTGQLCIMSKVIIGHTWKKCKRVILWTVVLPTVYKIQWTPNFHNATHILIPFTGSPQIQHTHHSNHWFSSHRKNSHNFKGFNSITIPPNRIQYIRSTEGFT